MSLLKEHFIKTIPSFRLKAEYAEEFGVLKCELSPRNIGKEWAIYVIKEALSPVLLSGTLYTLCQCDALLVPPYESIHLVSQDSRFRFYRILIDGDFLENHYSLLVHRAHFRRARFVTEESQREKLFALCEDLLGEEKGPLFAALSLLELLASTHNDYSEEDEDIEHYEVCLPISLKKVMLHVKNNLSTQLTASAVSEATGVSAQQIAKLFKTHLSLSFKDYVTWVRMLAASELLLCKDRADEVAKSLAYTSAERFTSDFRKIFGTTPSKYLRSGGVVCTHRLPL